MAVEPDAGFDALRTIVEEGDTARVDAILDTFDLSEEIVTEANVETFVATRCHAEDAPTRRLAARAAGYLHEDAGAVTCLPELLRDGDIAVARAAAASIGRLRYESAFPPLVESLARRPLRASVRKAIARFGADKIDSLAARFRDEAENPDVRVALPLVLAEFDDPRAGNALFASLPQDDRRLHYQGVKGLGKLRKRSPDLRLPRNEVDRLLKGEASRLAALASLRSGITSVTAVLESHLLLIRVLDERLEFTRERIFRLLGLVYPPDAVFSAFDRIVNGRPAVRAAALEYLSNVLSKRHRASLFPLVEAENWTDVQSRSQELFGSSAMSFDEALTRLVRHRDPWLAATAVTVVANLDVSPIRSELEAMEEHPSKLVREAVQGALHDVG